MLRIGILMLAVLALTAPAAAAGSFSLTPGAQTVTTEARETRPQNFVRNTTIAIAAFLSLLAAIRYGIHAETLVQIVFICVLVAISRVDLERRIIPNRIVVPAWIAVLLAHLAIHPHHWVEWLVASFGAGLFFLVVALVYPGGLRIRLREDFAKTSDPPGTELTGRIESTTNIIAPDIEYALARRFSLGANYNQYLSSRNQSQIGERGSGSIVITPEGRGPDGWYYGHAGADTMTFHFTILGPPDLHVVAEATTPRGVAASATTVLRLRSRYISSATRKSISSSMSTVA